jgi:glutathione S-transferase
MTQLYYFKGRGRAETTRWMLAANGIAFRNVSMESPDDLASLRLSGKLPFDQMPLLETDGLAISQTTALIRYLARRGDFYGDTPTDALWCDMIAGVASDLAEPAIQACFQPSNSITIKSIQERFGKFGLILERRLAANGGQFSACSRLSFADVVLVEALTSYLEIVPDILKHSPLLTDLQYRVTELPEIKAYLSSPQRFPVADETCVIDVARVLERALPQHIEDPNRSVRSD